MIIYHLAFDLYFFRQVASLDPFSLPLIILARATAVIFLFLVGFSFYLSQQKYSTTDLFHHSLKRSLTLFGWASLITIVTFLLDLELMVRFGILSLISTSLLLLVPLSLIPQTSLIFILGLLVLAIGFLFPQSGAASFDYFPVFPWFGVSLLGYATAVNWADRLPVQQSPRHLSWITLISRHSLAIYLLHQPLIITLLLLIK